MALESALAELSPWGGHERLRRRLEALRDERPTVAAAANSAVEGGLDEVTAEAVARVLGLLEGALLARTEVGLE